MKFGFSATFVICCMILAWTTDRASAEGWDEVFEQPRAFEVMQGINYRSGPNKNNEVLGVLKQGERLAVFGLEKGWYKFQKTDGTTGYVFKKFLQPASGDAPVVSASPGTPGQPEQPGAGAQPTQPAQPGATPSGTVAPGALPGQPVPGAKPGAEAVSDCARLAVKQGAATTSTSAVVAAGVQDCFVLPVTESQWVEIWLITTEGKASFDIYSPVGAAVVGGETHWLGRTDVTGNYIILVSGKAEKTEYTIKAQVR
jgi:hypothetical protein